MVSVILYPCIFCVALLMDVFVLFAACLTVCELFGLFTYPLQSRVGHKATMSFIHILRP